VEFPGTSWTQVREAQAGDNAALRELSLRYRPPVVAYLRRRFGAEAEDLAQEVFLRLFGSGVLERADPTQGRFRGLLVAVARNVAGNHLEKSRAEKRGGQAVVIPLGDLELAAREPDEAFDHEWIAHLLEVALARLEREHANYHQALSRFLLDGQPQTEIAEALGCTPSDVKNHVHRGKRKVIGYLQDEVRRYAGSQREYEEELRYLSRLLPL
jgi:RNA polymerase sigma factor (sigma-70 family)